MSIERIVFAVAGFFIMLSLALGVEASPIYHHSYWLFFTAFVGLNLFQTAFTGLCPMFFILKALGFKKESDKGGDAPAV
ncbi:DUF2892 domain-containing protein [Ectothiorhodospiraceae bacterium BW-2]|nr:DUF2892 domain-containing protein [Ectothiorhodospiraceae bacterium BW-2]